MRVAATRITTTSGHYAGEEGVGYRWGAPEDPGDFSADTGGRMQGREEECRIEILVPRAVIETTIGGTYLCVPTGTMDSDGWQVHGPLDAAEAVARGLARVVEE